MNRIIIIIILTVLSTACTVYKDFPIDVYKPGEVSVPSNAKNLVLVYRNFKYPTDTLQHYYKDNYQLKKAADNSNLDSVLVVSCLKELAQNLKSMNLFNEIKIMPYHTFKRHSSEKLPEFSFDLVKKICETTGSDLLISLETYSYFFSEYQQDIDNPESNEVITANVWAVLDPLHDKLIERKALIDTIFWNKYDDQGNYQRNYQLPARETALKIASQLAGENYAKRFNASWQTVHRTLTIPPLPDFSLAANYVNDGEWEKAIPLWEKYVSDKNGKLAIDARYNIALAYEMKDDIVNALKWVDEALKLAMSYKSTENIKMILAYQKILQQRRKDIILLNQNQN